MRWATIFRIKLEVDGLPGIDNEWADALNRDKDSVRGFLLPEQRVSTTFTQFGQSTEADTRTWTMARPVQLLELERRNVQVLVPHGF